MTYAPPRDLSVVICCYSLERWDLLVAAVDSVLHQTRPVHQVIVVVDHNDLLLERVQTELPGVLVVPNQGAAGLSDARNTGIGLASGDVVAFLDDDAAAEPDWALHLMNAYRFADVLGVGGRVIPRFASVRPAWLPAEFDWVVGCTYVGHPNSRGPIRNMIGANMSLRRDVFAVVGGFRADLGRTASGAAGCEETELCIRAGREMNGTFYYEPDAVVWHFVAPSRTSLSYFRKRCYDEGRSKALIARVAGRYRGLSSERHYVTHVLPRAFLREGRQSLVGRPGAWRRAKALLTGLLFTTAGYLRARLWHPKAATIGQPEFDPIFVTTIDLEAPEDLVPPSPRYRRALALVRRGSKPLRILQIMLPKGEMRAPDIETLLGSIRREDYDEPRRLSRRGGDEALVTVVVATRDRPEALRRCLDSLKALHRKRFEVVVVDNGSRTREAAEVVEAFAREDERYRYVREDRQGLARAHNRGLQDARGTIVAFTDDDVVVDPNWLDAIVDAFRGDLHVACVTGMIFPSELETVSQWWTETWIGLGKGLTRRRFDLARDRPRDPLFPYTAGAFGSGANMAFRADVLRSFGGFDPALGTGTRARGGDDLAAFFEVISSGHAIVYEPRAIVFHAHRRDYEGLRAQSFGYGVGLGAYLTHVVAAHPGELRSLVARVPRGVIHLLHPRSTKNDRRSEDFPRELVWRERMGVLAGPWFYARSRLSTRHDGWTFEEPPRPAMEGSLHARSET